MSRKEPRKRRLRYTVPIQTSEWTILGDQMRQGVDFGDRVVAFVRRAAAIKGHGLLGRAHKQAGLCSAYLRTMPPGSIALDRLRAIIDGCELDVSDVFRLALDSGPVARFVADERRLAQHAKDLPAPVRDTINRMRFWWPERADVDLDAVDALRDENPDAARKASEGALNRVSGPRTYARALGIWGSIQATLYRLDYATLAIGLAIEAAQVAGDRKLLPVLLQRAAFVLRDRGELDWALEVSDIMLEQRASSRDLDAMGRAFVAHGSLLRSAGESAQAIRACRAGRSLLDTNSNRWHFAALQTLSLAHAEQGKLGLAEKAAADAGRLKEAPPRWGARLSWARARLARQQDRPVDAVLLYRETLGLLGPEPIDAARAGTELVRLLIEQGRQAEARRLAQTLSQIADRVSEHPLDFDKAISAAILDLALAGVQARLSVSAASRTLEAIDAGRRAAQARLRKNLRL